MKRDCRFVALDDKSCVDGKTKASFITYQRLCENSLATWWRNVFLTTSVSLAFEKRGDEIAFMLLLCSANILLAWSVWSYRVNLEKIMENYLMIFMKLLSTTSLMPRTGHMIILQ